MSNTRSIASSQTPQARDDRAVVAEDRLLTLDVLANDAGGAAKKLFSLNQTHPQTATPANAWVKLPSGAAISIRDGTIVYDQRGAFDHLAKGVTAQDQFSYAIRLGNGAVSTAKVTVTITGVNDAPVAVPDKMTGGENEVLTIDVLANDHDPDQGATLSLVSVVAPVGRGTATVVAGKVRFDPGTDFDHLAEGQSEKIQLRYKIADEHGATATGVATVTVTGAAEAPAGFVIDFEDLDNLQEVPFGYRGFNWTVPGDQMYVLHKDYLPGTGYQRGSIPPGEKVAFGPFGEGPLVIESVDGSEFLFDKVYITSAWDASQHVTLLGYRDNVLVGTHSGPIVNSGPTLFDVDWAQIDTLMIVHSGTHIALDNFYFG
ncbi:MAG: Ig-like domain-containing protein [Allosphingosinicella sp.]|uniref:Ig-like domain-containing protein n=1 Tax=Allosphingosinicella sp. TaxID=2823234 RepID=UPI00394CDBBF